MRLRIKVGESRPADYTVAEDQLIEDFLAQTFASETAAGRRIRLIYNGRVLDPGSPFSAYHIQESAILICSISAERVDAPVFQIDRFGGWLHLWILCGSILGLLWSLFFALDGRYFSSQTIGLLALMTVGLILWIALTVVPASGANARQNANNNNNSSSNRQHAHPHGE